MGSIHPRPLKPVGLAVEQQIPAPQRSFAAAFDQNCRRPLGVDRGCGCFDVTVVAQFMAAQQPRFMAIRGQQGCQRQQVVA
ncbi:MAG: Uncharacterised protein [Synechococcus sp. MIT S9220]|nr:MAG: Uncharacterised protein [Synechococcus sp. MIT S9220]